MYATPSSSLAEALQCFFTKGYRLADAKFAEMPHEQIQSDDWKLDTVQRFKPDQRKAGQVLLIAVSSTQKGMRLVFVEVVAAPGEFTPMHLVRRLFPTSTRHHQH
jgi:hypothetical protein